MANAANAAAVLAAAEDVVDAAADAALVDDARDVLAALRALTTRAQVEAVLGPAALHRPDLAHRVDGLLDALATLTQEQP